MYFILEKKAIGDLRNLTSIGRGPLLPPAINFMAGVPFDPAPALPLPLRYELDPEAHGQMPWFFDAGGPLMHNRMVAALHSAGVDNIAVYDALVVHPVKGREWKDYKAVNIIGRVAAADLTKSVVDPAEPLKMVAAKFDKLVLDPAKAHGLLMFRLAEKLSAIVVHEKVKQQIEADRIGPLGFIPPEDWFAGI